MDYQTPEIKFVDIAEEFGGTNADAESGSTTEKIDENGSLMGYSVIY